MKLTEETRRQCDVVFRNRNFMFNIKTKETLSLIIASDIYRSFFVSSLHSPPPIHMSVVGWHSNIWFTHTHTRRENDLAAIWLYTKQCHLQNFVFSHFRRLPSGYNWYQFQYWMITFVVHVRSSRSEYIGMPANMLTDQAYDSGGHSFFKRSTVIGNGKWSSACTGVSRHCCISLISHVPIMRKPHKDINSWDPCVQT